MPVTKRERNSCPPEHCQSPGCNKPHQAKGYCGYHYIKARREGLCDTPPCSISGCDRKSYARDLCHYHWQNLHLFGSAVRRKKCEAPRCTNNIKIGYRFCPKHKYRGTRGISFDLPPHASYRGKNNPRWRGGVAEYPNHSEFKRQRKIKLHAVNGLCEKCSNPATQVHHKDGTKWNHEQYNLEALCHKCHCVTHKGRHSKTSKFIRLYGMTALQLTKQIHVSLATVRMRHKAGTLSDLLEHHPELAKASLSSAS